jgi:hypothetical protein
VTITRTVDPYAGRSIGLAAAALAGSSLLVLAAAGPFAVRLAHGAGEVGRGAGGVAAATALILAAVVAGTVWGALQNTARSMRVVPLAASAVLFALTAALSLTTAGVTVAGNGRAAGLCLGYLLFSAIGAGVMFGIAAAPVADQDGAR